MGAIKLSTFLESNSATVRTLSRAGIIPCTVVRNFEIYIYYKGLTAKSKMQRYQDTAEAMRTNEKTVRNAVSAMEKTI